MDMLVAHHLILGKQKLGKICIFAKPGY